MKIDKGQIKVQKVKIGVRLLVNKKGKVVSSRFLEYRPKKEDKKNVV